MKETGSRKHVQTGSVMKRFLIALCFSLTAIVAAETAAPDCAPFCPTDFPCFRGPYQNGVVATGNYELVEDLKDAKLVWISEEQTIGTTWGPHGVGPAGQGRASPCRSAGYGGPVVAGDRVFLQLVEYPGDDELTAFDSSMTNDTRRVVGFYGVKRDGRPGSWNIETHDTILCMDKATGKTLWKAVFKHKGLTDNGHRHGRWNYPAVVGTRLYAQGTGGYVYCVDVETGKEIWVAGMGPATDAWNAAREAWKQVPQSYYQVARFPFCSSPAWGDGVIAVNDHGSEPAPKYSLKKNKKGVVVLPRYRGIGKGNAMVGLDAETGELLWRVTECAGVISSPVRWRVDGKDYFISGGPTSVVCVEAKSGKERWRIKGAFRDRVDPVVAGNLLVTVGDPRDIKLRGKRERLALSAYRITPEGAEKLWEEEPWTGHAWGCSPIVHRGHAYFADRLYDAETGAVTSSGAKFIKMGTSLVSGDWLFHYRNGQKLGEDGTAASASKLPKFSGENFISPTYADGRLYIRGTIPGSGKSTPAQRIKQGLVPEAGCVYCFDLIR